MKKTLSTMAAAAVLMASTAIAPAFAQTNNAAPATPGAQTDTVKPTAPGAMDDSAKTGAMGTSGATTMGAASGEYLTEQSETQVSANDYIGKSIYNNEDKSIGDVNDLILEENGGIAAVVVGVGGFLGIGEKSVALPIDKVNMTRDPENNEVRLTTMETADALKSAPEFKTLDDQRTAQTDTGAMDNTTTSSTNPAMPAAPGAVAPGGNAPAATDGTAPATTTRP
ncbi:PRC-barrel domain-containing protein [Rhizobium sp. SSA_523]|uniref:PRC-barrel domain-containing protein n=1 Tax=Rhizobium sp. SSA_523 TaxID=2952477 RepID=UPI0020918358|nr:PRC-barrel domain-containing protein [Rhizobium sp. SSA_523]MCO5731133.1 PRC-barrel domain-containing protein [Rhizobium sp. SSA_523]WKC24072.1 PRC-barrel domain-containing protein [Rhizobium sp. SSA_523]